MKVTCKPSCAGRRGSGVGRGGVQGCLKSKSIPVSNTTERFCYCVGENAAKYRVRKEPPHLNPGFLSLHCVGRSELSSLKIKEFLLAVNTSAKNPKV
ncbi:hypothetical protein I79_005004 [Cricetulus griseus]|uniref:Uncharacterized protein n=1 Tax=Cricetulus griseus TaxID=10029 RepID=G3H411_CRIGR|nr:hypothetical protein I79_005004 [Cricetulus griseus]ERE69790.1 hypothetical protein H671_6g16911 [Cricetulus griseus]